MKRNKTMKSIIALILCAFIAISGIGAEPVFAASKKMPLKVGFKGKTVDLITDIKSEKYPGSPKLSSVEKKWGKPKVKKDDIWREYTWKKGKTVIKASCTVQDDSDTGYIGGIDVSIKDKNGSLWGVKVGMTKAAALKKIKKATGINKVLKVKAKSEGDHSWKIDGDIPETDDYIATDGKTIIFVGVGYTPLEFELKNGKVTSIWFWRS